MKKKLVLVAATVLAGIYAKRRIERQRVEQDLYSAATSPRRPAGAGKTGAGNAWSAATDSPAR